LIFVLFRSKVLALAMGIQVGQFDPQTKMAWDSLSGDDVYSAKNQQIALEGAQQSAVLLRNPPGTAAHLPLQKGLKIAVVGPNGTCSDCSVEK
jgi:hypothetical protein